MPDSKSDGQIIAQPGDTYRTKIEDMASKHGWTPEEGEGAIEFLIRQAYHTGWQDGKAEALGGGRRL